ncbi:MAG: recombination protein RecR [Thermoleophilia bacterium]|nr:recombination protein RecR [Thermoleophilia bacterium]
MFSPPVERLITELSKLPGIGRRTAQRLTFHILRVPEDEGLALADAIREVKEKIGFCEICFNLTDQPICRICSNERRDKGLICVVEEPGDIIPVERTHEFDGLYHVLGGALSPIDGIGVEDLTIDQLLRRAVEPNIREVVLATNPTTTGEATALYIGDELARRRPDLKVTRPASGLPVGADLEYTDEVTLGRAFQGRRTVN